MFRKNYLIFILSLILAVNCSWTSKYVPGVTTESLKLAPADYTVSGETSAKSCVEKILFFTTGDTDKYGYSNILIGYGLFGLAQSQALYEALTKLETANYIVNPKFDTQIDTGLFTTKVCVTVKAKGITLKSGPAPLK